MADDEILEFNFAGVQPATWGEFRALPRGEYQLQCVECTKYYTGESKGKADPSKPNLLFGFRVINHPDYENSEFLGFKGLSHSLLADSSKFLLNSLMCLIPEVDWDKNGIKIPLSQLMEKVKGATVNAVIDWEINNGTGDNANKRYVNNKIKALKKYDPTVPPPKATEGNPPIISNSNGASPIAQQAMAGVPADEVNSFLNDWPGGTPQPAAAVPAPSESNFFDEPF